MNSNIDDLLCKIRALEQELIKEIQNCQNTFIFNKQRKDNLFEKQGAMHLQLLLNYLNLPIFNTLND